MELIDSHCHLTADALWESAPEVLARAASAGVTRCITVAADVRDAERAIVLAARQPGVSVACGVHPHEAAKVAADDWRVLHQYWDSPAVVAAGEMGLDYHYDFSPRDVQRDVFARQLELAAETALPIVIHSREAHADVVRLLAKQGYDGKPVVFHCFTGSAEESAEIAAHGWRISFTGVVTFKKADALAEIAAAYPADKLLLETDSPYLSPEPVRHVRPNEPAHVVHIATFLAALRGEPVEAVAEQTTRNAIEFFGLKPRAVSRP